MLVVTDETCGLGHGPVTVVVYRTAEGRLDWRAGGQALPAGAVPVVVGCPTAMLVLSPLAVDRIEAEACCDVALRELAKSYKG